MGGMKWTFFAIGYQTGLAYILALIVYQIGMLITGHGFGFWTAVALVCLVGLIYMTVRPIPEKYKLDSGK